MKKQLIILASIALSSTFYTNLQGAEKTSVSSKQDEVLKRNQVDPTDIYAIPYDDSEVEDEEEINEFNRKQVFPKI